MPSPQRRKKMRPAIVVVGGSNTDLVLACPRLPQPGETLLGGEFNRFAGGKGANQAVAAARAGARVSFLGARGRDEFGAVAAAGLRREGISVTGFRIKVAAASGVALILLGGKTRENIIGVSRSANERFTARDVAASESVFRSAAAVLAPLDTSLPAVQKAATLAAKYKIPFILNPAPAYLLPDSLLRRVYVLTPNEHEVVLLAKEKSIEKAAAKLLRRGVRHVVVTLGARGAMLVDQSGVQYFKAPKIQPIDTVGAGDCFSAWLTVGLAEGVTLPEAITRAIKAAAIAVTRPGAQTGMPRRSEVR